jgi:hypothetical protein
MRVDESACPHCGAALVEASNVLARGAGAVVLGLALAGCPSDDDDHMTNTSVEPDYGVPQTESVTDSNTTSASMSSTSVGSMSGTGTDGSTGTSETVGEPEYGVPETGVTTDGTGSDSTGTSTSG